MVNKKLQGSTLIEVVMASMVVLIATSCGLLVFNSILKSDSAIHRNKLYIEGLNIIDETIQEQRFLDESIEKGNYLFEKKITTRDSINNCLNISINCFHKSKLLITCNAVVKTNE